MGQFLTHYLAGIPLAPDSRREIDLCLPSGAWSQELAPTSMFPPAAPRLVSVAPDFTSSPEAPKPAGETPREDGGGAETAASEEGARS